MSEGTNAVLALVQSLAPAVAYKESNLESNKKIWNLYAKVTYIDPYIIDIYMYCYDMHGQRRLHYILRTHV